jgi:hypothetical protein
MEVLYLFIGILITLLWNSALNSLRKKDEPLVRNRDRYTHIAYARDSTGEKCFSTTSSSGATFIGIYEDDRLEDSENPSDYTWSPIRHSLRY